MEAPPDMWIDGKPPQDKDGNEFCCLLEKTLFGLRQAGNAWGECFKDFLLRDPKYDIGFKELPTDPNLYVKNFALGGEPQQIILGVYVDDCMAAFSSHETMEWYTERLRKRFPVNPNSTGVIDKPPRSLPITAAIQLPMLKVAEISQAEYLKVLWAPVCIFVKFQGQVAHMRFVCFAGILRLRVVKSSTNTPVMQGAKRMHIERRCDCELPRQSCRLGRACVDF
jgi:hypothetical protein